MAVIEGRLQIQDWTDREGNKRRSAQVVADNVYFGDSKSSDSKNGWTAPPASGASFADTSAGEQDEGELPF